MPMTSSKIWRRIALGSILVNLFLVALIGGHLWRRDLHLNARSPTPVLDAVLARVEADLGSADAAAFHSVLERDRSNYLDDAKQIGASRDALAARIAAEPYDPVAVRAAFATWQAIWDRFLAAATGTIVDALGKVSPSGRQHLVQERRKAAPGTALP
jgi:uncharacterized membrane protein